ncbi:MAG: zinc-ribbon domain-containing protein [Spirochaetales bacterium]|uniref:Zinc-ribbon domain-containing protein n=1 Tax=Candidatus Thalassospirochaeta sargassi TaxID=3119039 RepID=A0AAJ1I9E8_9SPIO|nr:zinc-ribbon domain-containing protein [Spirochaetales bacterium]
MKCPECGRELQPDFNYCPECGVEVDRSVQFKQIVDDSFTRLEEVVQGDALLRLESLSSRLESIEAELELFLTSAPQKS